MNEKPVFIQIIEMIEDDILSGQYSVDDLIVSTTQIAKLLSVNQMTASKAVGILADRGVLTKRRGLGMAVTAEAREIILAERRQNFYESALPDFIKSAQKIGIDKQSLIKLIEEAEFND